MAHPLDSVFATQVVQRGMSGDGVDVAEVAAMRADLATVLAQPAIHRLLDIPDVAGTPTQGQVLAWDEVNEEWHPVTTAHPIQATVYGASPIVTGFRIFNVTYGLEMSTDEPIPGYPRVSLRAAFGGEGESNTVARSDHPHALATTTRLPIAPQGYMASGTRPLGSVNVVLPAGKTCLVAAKIDPLQIRGADPGPCYYQLSLTINGNTRSTPAPGTNGYWVVQGVPKDAVFGHERTIVGTGAAITVSASIAWGGAAGGFYTDAGDLVVTVTPDR